MENIAVGNYLPILDQQAMIILLTSTALCIYVFRAIALSTSAVKAPVVGYRFFIEPGWLVGLRFFRNSVTIINEGYRKVIDTQPDHLTISIPLCLPLISMEIPCLRYDATTERF